MASHIPDQHLPHHFIRSFLIQSSAYLNRPLSSNVVWEWESSLFPGRYQTACPRSHHVFVEWSGTGKQALLLFPILLWGSWAMQSDVLIWKLEGLRFSACISHCRPNNKVRGLVWRGRQCTCQPTGLPNSTARATKWKGKRDKGSFLPMFFF